MKKLVLMLIVLSALACSLYANDCRVMAGGYEVFLVKAGSATMSAQERANVFQSRMVNVMSLENAPKMKLETLKDGSINIWADNIRVATVGKRDADAAPGSIEKVAKMWADSISSTYKKASADKNKPKDTNVKLKKHKKVYKIK